VSETKVHNRIVAENRSMECYIKEKVFLIQSSLTSYLFIVVESICVV